jgi:hypothetical protein
LLPQCRSRPDPRAPTVSATAARQMSIAGARVRAAPTSRAAPVATTAAVRFARATSVGSATQRSPQSAGRIRSGTVPARSGMIASDFALKRISAPRADAHSVLLARTAWTLGHWTSGASSSAVRPRSAGRFTRRGRDCTSPPSPRPSTLTREDPERDSGRFGTLSRPRCEAT